MVLMDLTRILRHDNHEQQYVLLQERSGPRSFPIVIGRFEADAIYRRVNDIKPPRPMTHDLLASVIEQLQARLEWIVVNKLEQSTFFARLILTQNGKTVDVDARPSDAIALAVRFEVPIYVEEQVLEEVAKGGE